MQTKFSMRIKENTIPIFYKSRLVPFAFKNHVKATKETWGVRCDFLS